ncbi:hypothetical protein F5Y02DRAFT_407146 [Annulohypoxylon stygium]|nr:hypothetical protein F5Y02DRAFT_407146 [Annulohypoxylon stygium]
MAAARLTHWYWCRLQSLSTAPVCGENFECGDNCECLRSNTGQSDQKVCTTKALRRCALGFLYSYSFIRDFLGTYEKAQVHPRFHRGELRLSRLNFLSRFTQWPLFTSYIRATVFVALILIAMQVALATDQIKTNPQLMVVSYSFSVFAILAPLSVVLVIVLEVAYNLLKDNLLSAETTSY